MHDYPKGFSQKKNKRDFSHCYQKLKKKSRENVKLRLVTAILNEGVLVLEYLPEDRNALIVPRCLFSNTVAHVHMLQQRMRLRLTQVIGYTNGINGDIHMVRK